MKSPLVYFGGKSRVADRVWERFGDVPNFIEPFCGSAATLLARPHAPRAETLNDADCYVANFWRALQYDARGVAEYADWPVNEADVFARHNWLARQEVFREMMKTDPYHFDIRVAGWWIWESGLRIGTGSAIVSGERGSRSKPKNNPGGIHALRFRSRFYANFDELSARLRNVRVLCGDWKRCLTPAETTGIGPTAVLLDPPYLGNESVYAEKSVGVSTHVREWALLHGDDPMFRIALCGYREHEMPPTWTAFDWKAAGGYGNQSSGQGRANAKLERIWFSPHCVLSFKEQRSQVFDELAEAA